MRILLLIVMCFSISGTMTAPAWCQKTTKSKSVETKKHAARNSRTKQKATPAVTHGKGKNKAGNRKSRKRTTAPSSGKKDAGKTAPSKEKIDAGPPKEARLKQDELNRLKQEIQEYEAKINESRKKEKNALNRIGDYEKQIALLKKLMAHLSDEIGRNEREVVAAKGTLVKTETELQKLRSIYARYIVNLYKKGRTHDAELLMSSASLNQMFIRAKYLKAFSLKHRKRTEEISAKKKQIEEEKKNLELKLSRQKQTATEKMNEETHLRKKTEEHQELLGKVRQDKAEYEKQLKRKQIAAQKLERLISDIIEKDRKKRLAELNKRSAAPKTGKGTSRNKAEEKITSLPSVPITKTAFGKLRGRLPWPVSQGAVVGTFGEQTNPRLGTVTISNGIDIKAPVGTPVRVVADGEVTMVSFIPGFGNLAIVNHKEGFFTVYASLSSLSVHEGQKVKAGQVIAKSGEGVSGPQLHFELWRERQKQNPIAWLSKR